MAMELFVNREAELRLIDEALGTLLDRRRLLRTPIIEFYGVEGIGKTAMLKQIRRRCQEYNLPCIWADVGQSIALISRQIAEQAYSSPASKALAEKQITEPEQEDGWLALSLEATRNLSRQRGAAVLLLDAVNPLDEEQVHWLEALLRELTESNAFLVVLACQREQPFARERAVARTVALYELAPLDRQSCDTYLSGTGLHLAPEVRELIFEWTRGYPLAMEVLTEAIQGGLDPRRPEDRQTLLQVLTERVIHQRVLRKVSPERRGSYEELLRLLSMPRRFNLVILQELIERFAPALARESSLAYFSLPREISAATEVLRWRLERAGYAVETPVRQLFLLKQRMEDPTIFIALHRFLAELNQQLAERVGGTDRVRYLREWLYHSALVGEAAMLPTIIQQILERLQSAPAESRVHFAEEYRLDHELQEALGAHGTPILAALSAWDHPSEG
jgi:hypothetical protein